MKLIHVSIFVFTLIIMSCDSDSATGLESQPGTGTEVGKKGADFTYTSLQGNEVSLSDYTGKVVLIYLFGNQCPSCLSSGSLTETDINQAFKETGEFQALGLDTWDNTSTIPSVQAFKDQTGITFPLLRQAGSMVQLYATTYDRLIVIDQEGIIQFKGTTAIPFEIDGAVSKIAELLQ